MIDSEELWQTEDAPMFTVRGKNSVYRPNKSVKSGN
jgi:hypothetical protein